MKIVVALGGNALGETPAIQKQNAMITAKYLIALIKEGHQLIITHGNGPQVGLINLAFDEGNKVNEKVYQMPFGECGAMSQGYIGYHLQNALINEMKVNNINKQVVSLITQVEVDPNDKAFEHPTKPIGSFYTKEEAMKMNCPVVEDANRGYRRVVASPKPQKVLEEKAINSLVEQGYIVITCGGGGIPVIYKDNKYIGVDAVIDKDFASSKLASDVNADCLLIITAISNAKINFGKENEKDLFDVTCKDLEKYNAEGHFKAGSMKPKIEACIAFVKNHSDRTAIITNIDEVNDAIKGIKGTRIRN